MILGVDRLMSEARSVTNLIGNGVATVLVSKWENEFDQNKADEMLNSKIPPPAVEAGLVDSPENLAATAAQNLDDSKN